LRNTGLNDDVISIDWVLVVSRCAVAVKQKNETATIEIILFMLT
jgi:hypothetical protein